MSSVTALFAFKNTYLDLPERCYAKVRASGVRAPRLLALNRRLCAELGLDALRLEAEAAEIFSGNVLPDGAASIAQVYAGHQFGGFVPVLGDGRALLLGEVCDVRQRMRDIQLKGAGATPFSRRGDGRSTLASVLREYVVSEGMAALGVPSTRALAAVLSGETVYRETAEPGAVFTRVAASHVRVGTFEYFAARQDTDALRCLADYVIARHYPACAEAPNPYLSLLEEFSGRFAALVAGWMSLGFVHGVMNTDNTAISGETLDFGPCAFVDVFRQDTVFSAIDRQGRYAYSNQPHIAQWNLARFAETLLPLLDPEVDRALALATEVVHRFPGGYEGAWMERMLPKFGLQSREDGDAQLFAGFLNAMQKAGADFTRGFRQLGLQLEGDTAGPQGDPFFGDSAFLEWAPEWRARLGRSRTTPGETLEIMRAANPAVIPRNHRVAEAIKAAVELEDFRPFERLLERVTAPFEETEASEPYALAPLPAERVLRTYCGT